MIKIALMLVSLIFIFFVNWGLSFIPWTQSEKIHSMLLLDSDLLWRVQTNFNGIFQGAHTETDDQGFRHTPNSHCDGKNFTIWIMGASPSFGWGVNDEETYASLLATSRMPNLCIKNYSAIGYSSSQGLKLLKRLLAKAHPDLVIVTYMVNDIDFIRFYFDNAQSDEKILNTRRNEILINLLNWTKKSNLFRITNRVFSSLVKRKLFSTDKIESREQRTTLSEYEKNLESFYKLSTDHHFTLFFIRPPDSFPYPTSENKLTQDNLPHDPVAIPLQKKLMFKAVQSNSQYEKIMDNIANKHQIRFINMDKVFKKDSKLFCGNEYGDFVHPNRQGHLLYYNILHKQILEGISL